MNFKLVNQGFTLIELLVVVFVMGIILTFAVLSFDNGGLAQRQQQEAERLAVLLQFAGEEAILQNREVGVRFEADGYGFYVWEGDRWVGWADEVLRPRVLMPDLVLGLQLEGQVFPFNQSVGAPQVVLLSSGEWIPFVVWVRARSGLGQVYQVRGDWMGQVEVRRYEVMP